MLLICISENSLTKLHLKIVITNREIFAFVISKEYL